MSLFSRSLSCRVLLYACCIVIPPRQAQAQDATQLFYKLRDRLGTVQDYVADVRMKIDVRFMRVPLLSGKLYYKAPGKLRLERNGGISVLPRKSISLSIDGMLPTGKVTVIDAGSDRIGNTSVRVIKVIPEGESEIVLAELWVDASNLLVLKTETTSRGQGTVRMELSYGKYARLALPDKVVFVMDLKDYKLPKGVTMDYDEGGNDGKIAESEPGAIAKRGRIEIRYLSYQVNIGLSDSIFTAK